MTFHVLALAPAAIGLCCLAADRRRARIAELGAAVLMMVAMLDAAITAIVPVVFWVALLVAGAMVLAAVRGRARAGVVAAAGAAPSGASTMGGSTMGGSTMGGSTIGGGGVAMAVHSASGMVVMAALLLAMAGGAAATGGHHHGGTPSVAWAATGVAAVYVVASVVLAARTRGMLLRTQYAAMAASVGLMAVALTP